jgi:hypothetical protein
MLVQVFETCTSRIRSRNANLSKRSLVTRIPLVTECELIGWYFNAAAKLKRNLPTMQGLFENLALNQSKYVSAI